MNSNFDTTEWPSDAGNGCETLDFNADYPIPFIKAGPSGTSNNKKCFITGPNGSTAKGRVQDCAKLTADSTKYNLCYCTGGVGGGTAPAT